MRACVGEKTKRRTAAGKAPFAGVCSFALTCLVALACAALPTGAAHAVGLPDTGRVCSLRLDVRYDGNPVPGLDFDLWRVGDLDAEGNPVLLSAYEGSGVDFSALKLESEWDAAAKQLQEWLRGEGGMPPQMSGLTNAGGVLEIGGLPSGVYLVSEAGVSHDGTSYLAAPCLIALPHLDAAESAWLYDVTAKPKTEAHPENPAGPDDPAEPGAGEGSGDASGGEGADGAGGGPAAWLPQGALGQTGDVAYVTFCLALIAFSGSCLLVPVARRKRAEAQPGCEAGQSPQE